MSAANWVQLSQVAIFIGLVLTALGGYGAYHFGKKVDEVRSEELDRRFDEILSSVSQLSLAQRERAGQLLESALSEFGDELNDRFPLGFALLFFDEREWYAAPLSLGDTIVDWSTLKIVGMTQDYIQVQLPSTLLPGENVLHGNISGIARRAGAEGGGVVVGDRRLVFRVLRSNAATVTVAAGIERVQ